MGYNWRNTLPSYAAISGVLAGFSITFIVFIISRDVETPQLAFGLTWGNFAVLTLGICSVLFIAASQYFLTAKNYDIWNLADAHRESLSQGLKGEGKSWDEIVRTALRVCGEYERRGRWLYNVALVGLFSGLFFAIGSINLPVASIVAMLGIGFEMVQILQHFRDAGRRILAQQQENANAGEPNRLNLDTNVASSVLSLYGAQLTSHAALIVASIIAALSLVQASQVLDLSRLQLSVALAAILTVVVYLGVRLLVYGTLARAVTHGTTNDLDEFARERSQRVPLLLQHALVNEYAIFFLNRRSKLGRFYNLRHKALWVILAITWLLVVSIATYGLGV